MPRRTAGPPRLSRRMSPMSARIPPSPRLSSRRIQAWYFTPTTRRSVQKISDANPWQKDYNWVTSELVTWTSNDGVQLQGILYKPENFDPSKKYPMVSYFYEDLSDGLYNYIAPTGRNVINPTHYVSNGYLVFEPDIVYEDGYPGPSAYKSIVPGVEALLPR